MELDKIKKALKSWDKHEILMRQSATEPHEELTIEDYDLINDMAFEHPKWIKYMVWELEDISGDINAMIKEGEELKKLLTEWLSIGKVHQDTYGNDLIGRTLKCLESK